MDFKIKKLLDKNDILLNNIQTYPKELIERVKSNKIEEIGFNLHLINNDYNIIAFHCSRLTEYEINEIKKNGLRYGGKQLLLYKINNLPKEISREIKDKFIEYVNNLEETQADNSIYFAVGKLDLIKDRTKQKIFIQH